MWSKNKTNRMSYKRYITLLIVLCPLLVYGHTNFLYSFKNKKKTPVDNRFKPHSTSFKRHFILNIDGGISMLRAENKEYKQSYNGRLGITYQFSKYLGVKANLGYGLLNGDFSNHGKTLIESNYYEATLRLRIDFLTLINGYDINRKVNIYPTIGVGQMQSRIKFRNKDNTITAIGYDDANSVSAGGISGRIVALTYSIGGEIEIAVTNNIGLYIDATAFYADSDRIDGIVILNSSNDWYITGNIGLNFKLKDNYKKRTTLECKSGFRMITNTKRKL